MITLLGCTSNSPKWIDSSKINKDVRQHIDKLKSTHDSTLAIHLPDPGNHKIKSYWVQPHNKIVECLIYRDYINHYSKKTITPWNKENGAIGYKLFWDGSCKDGYAFGLGGEIEKGRGISRHTLSRYSSDAKIKPIRYIQEDYLNGYRREGDLNNHIYVDVGYENRYKSSFHYGLFSMHLLKDIVKIDKIKKYTKGTSNNVTYGLILNIDGYASKVTTISFDGTSLGQILDNKAISHTVKYGDGSHLSIVRGFFDSTEYSSNVTTYENKNNKLHGILNYEDTFEAGTIFERDVGKTKLYNNGALIGSVEKPEEYKNIINIIERDIIDFSNEALVKRALSLIAKKEYTDRVCSKSFVSGFTNDSEYKGVCSSLELDKKLTEYISLIGNIRRNSEKFKEVISEREWSQTLDLVKRHIIEDFSLRNIANAYMTSMKINQMKSNIEMRSNMDKNSSGLQWNPVYVRPGEGQNLGGGFGSSGFDSKPNIPNPNYYCETYTDDYVCNQNLMRKRYLGSSGSRYKYDLSSPFDRMEYSTDIGSQINDTFSSDKFLDQGQGQFGGGID